LALLDFDPSPQDLQPAVVTPLLSGETAAIWSALVMGVRDYARKCGFTKVVLGLSGGIDSSLVAAIAAAAVGPKQVLGVLMPSPYSSDHSISDAEELVKNLGIGSEHLPIGDLMQSYDQLFDGLFAGTEFGVAEENIQSRIRGNLLMAIANKFGYMLVSTGNKSEMAVGYCTLYGDMNGGLAAIADVPKTKVYALCRWLNQHAAELRQEQTDLTPYPLPCPDEVDPQAPIVPPSVIRKPPSAELKPGQQDADSLPGYDVLDDILERLILQHQSPAQIAESGHDPDLVQRVFNLVRRAEFKRRQAPPGLKITDRAFGTGWRMPIASRWTLSLPQPLAKVDSAPTVPTPASET
jgi:NAD+ synthetase